MAGEIDLERLVVALEAQSAKLEKNINASASLIDKRLGEIEKRTDLMRTRVENSFAAAGTNAVRKFTNALLATGAIAGIERFVASIVSLAENIKHTSDATGVSAENLQAWGIAARAAGVNSESFSAGIERFTKKFGEATLGNKQLQLELTRLGINLKGNVTDAFLKFADKVAAANTQAKQVAITTAFFGKDMADLAPLLALGSQRLQQITKDLVAQGRVLSDEQIKKIDDMKQKWEDLKQRLQVAAAPAVLTFFDAFSKFIGDMDSPQFQTSLKNFAAAMAEIAGYAVKLAPALPIITGALIGSRFGGAGGAIVGAAVGATAATDANKLGDLKYQASILHDEIEHWYARPVTDWILGSADQQKERIAQLKAINAQIKAMETPAKAGPAATTKPTGGGPPTNLFSPDETKRLAAEAQARLDALNRLAVAQKKADDDVVAADDAMHVAELRGLDGYNAAVLKQIADQRKSKLDEIDVEEKAEIDHLAKTFQVNSAEYKSAKETIEKIAAARRAAVESETKEKVFEATAPAILRDAQVAADTQVRNYNNQAEALGLLGGALAKVEYVQGQVNDAIQRGIPITDEMRQKWSDLGDEVAAAAQKFHDAQRTMQDNIAVTDQLRTGLEDVFTAGLKGFKSFKEAAANFLQQMAEIVLKTYVLKPIVEGLFGEQGTPFGGALGDLLGSGGAKPDGTPARPLYVKIAGAGGSDSSSPVTKALNSLTGQDEGQNTGGESLWSKIFGSSKPSTGEGNADDIEAGLFDSIQQGGKDAGASLTNALDSGGKGLGDVLMNAFKSGGDLLSSLFNGIFGQGGILSSLFGGGGGGGLFDIIGSLFGGGAGAGVDDGVMAAMAAFGFRDGGVMTARGPMPLRKYAGGGIATSPQLAMFGEGSGPEAFVPLRGGAIPVQLTMPKSTRPSAQTIQVIQTVYADRSILADDVFRQIEKSKTEAINEGAQKGATLAVKVQPNRDRNFKQLGT